MKKKLNSIMLLCLMLAMVLFAGCANTIKHGTDSDDQANWQERGSSFTLKG